MNVPIKEQNKQYIIDPFLKVRFERGEGSALEKRDVEREA